MASIYHSVSLPHPISLHSTTTFPKPSSFFSSILAYRNLRPRPTLCLSSSTATSSIQDEDMKSEESMSIDNLHSFFNLNIGKWTGSFHQFDGHGNLIQRINTRLSVSSYGEDELISLIQTLYIKQPSSSTIISGYKEKPEWAEYKIKETNMFTADKYQQIGFFPSQRAFALRYQTAGMLENVLRQGVLGEDDTEEESPKNLKLPSRRPSIVCETCLYSMERDMRARAFHIMDPKGVLEMLLVFLEDRGDAILPHPTLGSSMESRERIMPFLGSWKGRSITNRSGVYGATIAEANTTASLEIDGEGLIIQDINTTSDGSDVTTNVHWTGKLSNNLVTFDRGYQMTLLPGGMYMGCPCDITKSIEESKSFHLEFCWLELPGKRQRLVRTFDVDGLAVSTTYFHEVKI